MTVLFLRKDSSAVRAVQPQRDDGLRHRLNAQHLYALRCAQVPQVVLGQDNVNLGAQVVERTRQGASDIAQATGLDERHSLSRGK